MPRSPFSQNVTPSDANLVPEALRTHATGPENSGKINQALAYRISATRSIVGQRMPRTVGRANGTSEGSTHNTS